jgi:Ca2+-binding RTX toxin-like protein
MTGNLGEDTVNYALSTSAITINMVTNINTGGFAAGDTLATIETLIATDYADTITADSQNNIIYGGLQNDTINGGTGADILYGEDGDDTINGDSGNDKIYGGTGTNILNGGADNDIFYITSANNTETINGGSGLADVIDFSALTALVSINLSAGSISGGATNKTISNTENVRGTAYNDVITGDIFSNRLFGGNGNDTISGGINNDGLYGNDGDDILDGGLQNDILYGGAGIDNLTGGSGSDIFKYDVITESTTTNYDTITDFVIGTDKIDLALLVSDISGFGALTISNISGNTYSINDAAGSSFGLRATITGGTLSASDFVFG